MSAEGRRASARLAFVLYQRTRLLSVHPISKLPFLECHVVFNVRQNVGFGICERITVFVLPTSGWRNHLPELWRRGE